MTRPTAFIDVDETLIYSRARCSDSVLFNYDGEERFTSVRPSAREFLQALQDKGYILRIITQGWVSFQAAALTAVELIEFFHEFPMHGYLDGSIDPGPMVNVPDNWVLVDNDDRPYVKSMWLGHPADFRKRLINCDPYYGYGLDSEPLTELIPAIEAV